MTLCSSIPLFLLAASEAPKTRTALAWGTAPGLRPTTESGLKARATLAWGNAPGSRPPKNSGLKARAKCPPRHKSPSAALALHAALIPHEPLIELHPILREHRPHLGLEVPPLMVRRLRIDVPDQRQSIAWPDRKRRIPALPSELRKLRSPGLDPLRRRNLQPLHHLRDRICARDKQRNVNMIGNSAHPYANILRPIQHRSKIQMHLATNRITEQRPALFRAEDQMHQHVGDRLRHASEYSAGLQPAALYLSYVLGLSPKLRNLGPSARPHFTITPRQPKLEPTA
jgi:hypothetical protein